MIRMHLLAPGLALLVLAACTDPQAPAAPGADAAPAATPSESTPPPFPAPAPATPGFTTYACDDGSSLQVRYGEVEATVRQADGSIVTLPRAESASAGDGNVYVGQAQSLQRDGDAVEFHPGTGEARTCLVQGAAAESPATRSP